MKNEETHLKTFDIYDRVFNFACRVVIMDKGLSRNRRISRDLMNQLVRASTSVGSNLEEAKAGQSKADFHSKLRIALKEARESHYWLRLLAESGMIPRQRIAPLLQEANEIVAILTTIAKKSNPRNPS
jgi:four helix bundle protein